MGQLTAESARVMAGQLKNSPKMTTSNRRKKDFCTSDERYTMEENGGDSQSSAPL